MDETTPARPADEKVWQILLIAVIAIAFTAAWLVAYMFLHESLWMNDFVASNRWTIPAGVIVFSLLVGLCRKYLHAPDVISGGFTEAMKGEGSHGDYRIFPGTLLSSFLSLFSGASIGPEGSVAYLIMEISAFFRKKLAVAKDAALGFDVAALSSAYNGIIGSPLFTAVLATEFNIGRKDSLTFLAWNLLAGVIGFLFFSLLGLVSFASFISFPPVQEITPGYILVAFLLGFLGAFIAICMGLAMTGTGTAMDRAFGDRIFARILCAGLVIAVACYFIPDLMFSGETTIHAIIRNPAGAGVLMLLFMAAAKVLLLALSFKGGYLGGPIFPTVFACTMVGLALGLLFPEIPVGIFVLCTIAAVVTLALGTPLTAILLVVVMGSAGQQMTVLLVVSSVVALMIGIRVRQVRERRAAGTAGMPQ